MVDSRTEIRAGQRFAFGANWQDFIGTVDETKIKTAIDSLARALRSPDLTGRTFLDVGCGSGLFSLAAHRLGAEVRSFDFDAESVAATAELRARFAPDATWPIEPGSILDEEYVARLGQHDIVYSWGVLHHTGDLWRALAFVAGLVKPGGLLFVSVYNDQGLQSRLWRRVKRSYNLTGRVGRTAIVLLSAGYLWRWQPLLRMIRWFRGGQPPRARGMSVRHDLIDWVGGYPFEVAKPETVFDFLRDRGFELQHLKTCAGGLGCNEYVFRAPPQLT
ncbi:class I SAM-dependent methyltransferase [Paractinoplanes rishiriensis]|uniref:SAM-dependent methyltransferase n=1 Tax=Paractinoplanes rishiriensis TaxID=1050105 RepID=A0A919JTM6_9ACTN|nr:methyltransferase domain-containing protein [Actinoplanes rishiriensis]GIE93167.1 SAM-dependent methyltransferase [Actinoplanes rishiriensis]